MGDLPDAVLFACSLNSVRSPMGEALLKHLRELIGVIGHIQIAGVPDRHEPDKGEIAYPYLFEVMDEIGIDVSRHRAKSFDDLEDTSFDLIISLSPEAQHKAVDLTRTMACDVEFWNTFDPTLVEGSRETRLQAYRGVRDQLRKRIEERFALDLKPPH